MKTNRSVQQIGGRRRAAQTARLFLILLGGILFIAANVLLTGNVNASQNPKAGTQTPFPSPTPTFDILRLASPVVADLPTQSDKGAIIFWGVCIACHGDRGQGLTDEWRFGAYDADNNCWESECHGKDHPDHGFELPKALMPFPPVGTAGALGRFENAQQLYDYIVVMMPWWKPRSLTSEKAWQLTAYVLRLKDSLPQGLELNETNASAVPVHRYVAPPKNPNTAIFFFIGVIALAVIGLIVREFPSWRKGGTFDPITGPVVRPNFFAHLHPPTIPADQARWRYTLGAGGMAVFLSLVLLITGLLEMFYYIPTPEKAAISIETIVSFVPLGAFIRNLHYWAAQMLVVVALIHLARVIFTGAYGERRKFNFLLGLALFVFVVLLDFTGYVLRWDEGIRWALTAGTNLLKSIPWFGEGLYVFVVGGREPGPAALVRFYSWHIYVLTFVAGFFMIWHLFRVRRDGGIAAAAVRENTNRITRTELLQREVIGVFIGGIILLLISAFIPAPIASPIRGDTLLEAESSAPWFFLWVQQLLKSGDPFLLGVLLPLSVVILLGALPYLFTGIKQDELGRWFPRSGQRVQLIFIILAVIIITLTVLSILSSS